MPSGQPSAEPSSIPTQMPSKQPTDPTKDPTKMPSFVPSIEPSLMPTITPTQIPSAPSSNPTNPNEFETTYASTSSYSSTIASTSISDVTTPSQMPSIMPSLAPTWLVCDETVQTTDSYSICQFVTSFDALPVIFEEDASLLQASDYCSDSVLNEYFKCLDSENVQSITHIILNNTNISGELTSNMIDLIPTNVIYLDLSDNELGGEIGSWEGLENLETLNLANNELEGTIDLEDLSNLKVFNVANNGFTAIDDFEDISDHCPYLEQLIISNNEIEEDFELSYFSNLNYLTDLVCYNNSLISSTIDLNDIPLSLQVFECKNHDFGEFLWESETGEEEFSLQYLDLSNCRLTGSMSMSVLSESGQFPNLISVILSDNENLEIEIDLSYLDGSGIEYLDLSNTDTVGSVDFEYITNYIVIILDSDVYCVDSECEDESNGKNYGYVRTNTTCSGRTDCLETCTCETAYTLGISYYNAGDFGTYFIIFFLAFIGFSLRFGF